MKTLLFQTLRAALGVVLLLGLFVALAGTVRLPGLADGLRMGGLALAAGGTLFALLLRRVRTEDRIACLEAALCREQTARGQADIALAEADSLLGRLTARAARTHGGDPLTQLAVVQEELGQLRRQCAHLAPALGARIDLLCIRIDGVTRGLADGAAIASG